MRVLILGGNGFIGSHVVDSFLNCGHEVIVFDRHSDSSRSNLYDIKFFEGNFGDRTCLEKIFAEGIDVVVHLISTTLPQSSNLNPIYDVQSNLLESIALFELCVKYSIKKVVFLSSGGTVYGIPESTPVSEKSATHPLCSYGITKRAIEDFLFFFYKNHGLQYNVLRVSNPYGVRQSPFRGQGAIAVFMYKCLIGEEIEVWGDGSNVRDYVYVTDVANACLLAALSLKSGIYNVGSGYGVSILDLLENLENLLGVKPKIKWQPIRGFDVPKIILDYSLIQEELHWTPQIEFSSGFLEMQNWMQLNYKKWR